ncbi:MAG TPA: nucleoside hydrolase [Candidatus Acidoferrales bacterium]|nr:nucleoside hydrolase [Candidatus Acidoferrales bacterium]
MASNAATNAGCRRPRRLKNRPFLLLLAVALALPARGQPKRKVIIDQDARGPATTDEQAILALVQSPETDVLGITVVTGDDWRDLEVAHTLRMLEIIGRTDLPVVPGAVFPINNSREFIAHWETLYGPVVYQGAWNRSKARGPWDVPPLAEGAPSTKPAAEDAAHFLVRMVHRYPHQVTIYAAGPLTDLALAVVIDPHFAALARELVVMGGSIDPRTNDLEFRAHPHREFNFWMDPEAAYAVLRAPWPRILDTPVDISIKTRFTKAMLAEIGRTDTPAAQYVAKYGNEEYMWDELAAVAWLDPAVITQTRKFFLDVSTNRGATYGDTRSWPADQNPGLGRQLVTVNADLDSARFYRDFIRLMTRPTPGAHFGR